MVIRYLVYIILLVFSTLNYTNSKDFFNFQIKQSLEELNADCSIFDYSLDEFAGETDDNDNDNHFKISKSALNLTCSSVLGSIKQINVFTSGNFLLLNSYLDLPPPSIS